MAALDLHTFDAVRLPTFPSRLPLLHMDRILVFDRGKIIEDGTHKELLAKRGHYKNLWEAQVGGFLPDKKVLGNEDS